MKLRLLAYTEPGGIAYRLTDEDGNDVENKVDLRLDATPWIQMHPGSPRGLSLKGEVTIRLPIEWVKTLGALKGEGGGTIPSLTPEYPSLGNIRRDRTWGGRVSQR